MKEQRRGRIINIIAGVFTGAPDDANTAAAKSGIVGLSGTAAIELANFGVTCNMIAPGATTRLTSSTELNKHHLDSWLEIGIIDQKGYEKRLAQLEVPHEDGFGPEHVGPMVVYLCTDEASNINGKIFQAGHGSVGIYGESQDVVKQIFNNGEIWDLERLIELVPNTLLAGHRTPWSPQPEK
jgi:3-hydroxybutyrate dehydrogenase